MKRLILLSALVSATAFAQFTNSPVYVVNGKLSTAGSPLFAPADKYIQGLASADARFLATADFNNDGFPDIAIAGADDGNVTIYLNDTKGRMNFGGAYAADALGLRGITAGDFDGDGNIDIATINTSTGKVSVLMGKGDGSFKKHVDYTGLAGGYAITAGYIALQTNISLFVSGFNTPGTGVGVLPGIGDGGFGTTAVYAPDSGAFVADNISLIDINYDGNIDIVANDHGTDGVYLDSWLGLPDGGFGPASARKFTPLLPQGANGHMHAVAPLDCNNDGVIDVVFEASKGLFVAPGKVITTANAANVTTNLDSWDFGNFTYRHWFDPDYTGGTQIALGDFNGDGVKDVALVMGDGSNFAVNGSTNMNGVAVFFGDGKCGLSPPVFLPVNGPTGGSQFTFGITAGDYNQDGVTDIAIISEFSSPNTLFVWLSKGTPAQVNIANTARVSVADEPVPVSLRSMNPPTVLVFGSSVPQSVSGCAPKSCWNILCNAPSEYQTTFAIDAGIALTPTNGLEVPAKAATQGVFSWEKDICLTAPYGTEGDYLSETIIQLVSAADGGVCKVSEHKTFQQNP